MKEMVDLSVCVKQRLEVDGQPRLQISFLSGLERDKVWKLDQRRQGDKGKSKQLRSLELKLINQLT